MLLDTKTKAASLTEVSSQQLVFLDFQSTLKELHSLLSSHGDIASYLLITPNSEGSHSIPSCQREKYRQQRRLNIINKETRHKHSSVRFNKQWNKTTYGIYLFASAQMYQSMYKHLLISILWKSLLFNNSKTQSSLIHAHIGQRNHK